MGCLLLVGCEPLGLKPVEACRSVFEAEGFWFYSFPVVFSYFLSPYHFFCPRFPFFFFFKDWWGKVSSLSEACFRGLHSDVNTLMLVRLSQMIISHEKN